MRRSFDCDGGRIFCPETGRCLYDIGEQIKAVFMKPGDCGICGDEWVTGNSWKGWTTRPSVTFHLKIMKQELHPLYLYDHMHLSDEAAVRLREICTLVQFPWPLQGLEHDWAQFPIDDLLLHCAGQRVEVTISPYVHLRIPSYHGFLAPMVGAYISASPNAALINIGERT